MRIKCGYDEGRERMCWWPRDKTKCKNQECVYRVQYQVHDKTLI